MTAHQKAYRAYRLTDHWKALRAAALERDGNKCTKCSGVERLQVHHVLYRGRWEDTLLSDLLTFCRECHRKEHGFWVSEFASQERKFSELFDRIFPARPPVEEWKRLAALISTPGDRQDFGVLVCRYALMHGLKRDSAFAAREFHLNLACDMDFQSEAPAGKEIVQNARLPFSRVRQNGRFPPMSP